MSARRVAALLVVLAAALALWLLTEARAGATEPFRLSQQVTNTERALTPQGVAEVTADLDDLYSARKVRLFVVYVEDFGGLSSTDWARKTWDATGLGGGDALLAVAITTPSSADLVVPTNMVSAEQYNVIIGDVAKSLGEGGGYGNIAGAAEAAARDLVYFNASPAASASDPPTVEPLTDASPPASSPHSSSSAGSLGNKLTRVMFGMLSGLAVLWLAGRGKPRSHWSHHRGLGAGAMVAGAAVFLIPGLFSGLLWLAVLGALGWAAWWWLGANTHAGPLGWLRRLLRRGARGGQRHLVEGGPLAGRVQHDLSLKPYDREKNPDGWRRQVRGAYVDANGKKARDGKAWRVWITLPAHLTPQNYADKFAAACANLLGGSWTAVAGENNNSLIATLTPVAVFPDVIPHDHLINAPPQTMREAIDAYRTFKFPVGVNTSGQWVSWSDFQSVGACFIAGGSGGGKSTSFITKIAEAQGWAVIFTDFGDSTWVEDNGFDELPNIHLYTKRWEHNLAVFGYVHAIVRARRSGTAPPPGAPPNGMPILLAIDEIAALFRKKTQAAITAQDQLLEIQEQGRAARVHPALASQNVTARTVGTDNRTLAPWVEQWGRREPKDMRILHGESVNVSEVAIPDAVKGRGIITGPDGRQTVVQGLWTPGTDLHGLSARERAVLHPLLAQIHASAPRLWPKITPEDLFAGAPAAALAAPETPPSTPMRAREETSPGPLGAPPEHVQSITQSTPERLPEHLEHPEHPPEHPGAGVVAEAEAVLQGAVYEHRLEELVAQIWAETKSVRQVTKRLKIGHERATEILHRLGLRAKRKGEE